MCPIPIQIMSFIDIISQCGYSSQVELAYLNLVSRFRTVYNKSYGRFGSHLV